MAEGLKHDQEKPRMELLDPEFLEGVAQVLTFGAKKYAAHNWRGGIAIGRLLGATLRHLFAFSRGEDVDKESGLHHLLHAGCELMFLYWTVVHKPELDDRYKEEPKKQEYVEVFNTDFDGKVIGSTWIEKEYIK